MPSLSTALRPILALIQAAHAAERCRPPGHRRARLASSGRVADAMRRPLHADGRDRPRRRAARRGPRAGPAAEAPLGLRSDGPGRWAAATSAPSRSARGAPATRQAREAAPLAFRPDTMSAPRPGWSRPAPSVRSGVPGRVHEQPQRHAIQARILETLLEAGAHPTLAFEMVPETPGRRRWRPPYGATPPRPRWIGGRLDARAGPTWRSTGKLFELAQRYRPTMGAGLNPAWQRRGGRLAAAGPDPGRLGSALATIRRGTRRSHGRLRAAHCGSDQRGTPTRMLDSSRATSSSRGG